MNFDDVKNYSELERKLTTIDNLLKYNFVNLLQEGFNHFIKEDFRACFRSFSLIFLHIEVYDTNSRDDVLNLYKELNDYFDEITVKPSSKREMIEINNKQFLVKSLVFDFLRMIVESCIELGLWFKDIKVRNDIDLFLSEQNFNTELSTLDEKVEVLKGLDKDVLFCLMKPNVVHKIFAAWLVSDDDVQ